MQGHVSSLLASDNASRMKEITKNDRKALFKLFQVQPINAISLISNNISYPLTNILGIYGKRYMSRIGVTEQNRRIDKLFIKGFQELNNAIENMKNDLDGYSSRAGVIKPG